MATRWEDGVITCPACGEGVAGYERTEEQRWDGLFTRELWEVRVECPLCGFRMDWWEGDILLSFEERSEDLALALERALNPGSRLALGAHLPHEDVLAPYQKEGARRRDEAKRRLGLPLDLPLTETPAELLEKARSCLPALPTAPGAGQERQGAHPEGVRPGKELA